MLTSIDAARTGTPQHAGTAPLPRRPAATRPVRSAGDAAATASLAALTIASSWGLLRVFASQKWVVPFACTVGAVHLAGWAGRRFRLPAGAAVAAGIATGLMVTTWTVLGATTAYGLPSARTFTTATHALKIAYNDIPSVVAPVQATRGFVLAAVIGGALVALVGDWLAFRTRSALWGAAPAFGLFVTASTVGYGPGRSVAVSIEAAAVLAFTLVHRASGAGAGHPWLGGERSGAISWAVPAGCAVAAASMLTVLLVAPVSNGLEGRGVLGWHSGTGGGGGAREVANPIVDLHNRLIQLANVGVFTVRSPVPSYWRLTSLDTFTGQAWVATNSYRGFGSRLPGIAAAPPGTRTIRESFSVQNLESVWLPAAFTPIAVTGVKGVGFDPGSASLITSHRTSDGLRYEVTSYQYLSSLSAGDLEAVGVARDDATTARYLALPKGVPQSVYALALSITAGKATEYGKAIALQDFFQGPSFRYSLDPPNDGFGMSALTNFLFSTRTGYCQQFAGSYAVLARAVGLPTRLAVGFATGTDIGGSTYQVIDADAHTWPEVYFGPKLGWIPFEPTKSFSDPSATTYAPPSGADNATSGPGADLPSPAPHGTPTPLPKGAGAGATTTLPAPAAANPGHSSGTSGGWKVFLVATGLLAAWLLTNTALRRARRRFRVWRAHGDVREEVLGHWRDVGEVLDWWGVTREPGDTDAEYARRAGESFTRTLREPTPWVTGGVARLASLATEASFAPELHRSAQREADLVAREVRQRLLRVASARQLVLWALVQKPYRRR